MDETFRIPIRQKLIDLITDLNPSISKENDFFIEVHSFEEENSSSRIHVKYQVFVKYKSHSFPLLSGKFIIFKRTFFFFYRSENNQSGKYGETCADYIADRCSLEDILPLEIEIIKNIRFMFNMDFEIRKYEHKTKTSN